MLQEHRGTSSGCSPTQGRGYSKKTLQHGQQAGLRGAVLTWKLSHVFIRKEKLPASAPKPAGQRHVGVEKADTQFQLFHGVQVAQGQGRVPDFCGGWLMRVSLNDCLTHTTQRRLATLLDAHHLQEACHRNGCIGENSLDPRRHIEPANKRDLHRREGATQLTRVDILVK